MRNHPDEIQRQRIVDNNSSSTAAVRADLIDVIHGTLSRESESPATLMTFEFRFISTSLSRRIQSATIRLQFADAHSRSELDPEVFRIAPDGSIAVGPATTQVILERPSGFAGSVTVGAAGIGASWERETQYERTSSSLLIGNTMIVGRKSGRPNAVLWKLIEDKLRLDGVPSFLRTAVLLKRNCDDRFLGTIHIDIKTSGLSSDIRQTIRRAVGGIEDDDPVLFDPRVPRISGPLSETVDQSELSSYALDRFASVVAPSFEDTERLAKSEKRDMANLTARLDATALGIPVESSSGETVILEQEVRLEGKHEPIELSGRKVPFWTAKPQPTANTNSKPKSHPRTEPQSKRKLQSTMEPERKPSVQYVSGKEQETFLVELWRTGWTGLPSLIPEAGQIESNKISEKHHLSHRRPMATFLKTLPDIFGDVPSDLCPGQPTGDLLKKYFPWCNDKQLEEVKNETPNVDDHECCALIVRREKTESIKVKTLRQPMNIFPQDVLSEVMDFLHIPNEYQNIRGNDTGTCEALVTPGQIHLDESFQAYIIQTPFYTTGFWSLVLSYKKDPSRLDLFPKVSGVLQVDDAIRLKDIFSSVCETAKKSSHAMLLPIQLFEDHCVTSQLLFQVIIANINLVAQKISDELTSNKKGSKAKADKLKDNEYAVLNQTLHLSSLDLVDLERRRDFEKRFGNLLKDELTADLLQLQPVGPFAGICREREVYNRSLLQRVGLAADMSKNRDLDIQSLPWRIESQRGVLNSMIAQRDNKTKLQLAQASKRDSTALTVISVMTLLFLPGAYVATLFTTNMFAFKDGQEVWVYFTVVIPLTAFVMSVWYFWIRDPKANQDEESGGSGKDDKQD